MVPSGGRGRRRSLISDCCFTNCWVGLLRNLIDHFGDDQVGALDLRASVCALRSHAGCRRFAGVAATGVDRCRHGLARSAAMAFNRLADASIDAANPRMLPRSAGRRVDAGGSSAHRLVLANFCVSPLAVEPPHADAFAGGAGGDSFFIPTASDSRRWSHLFLGIRARHCSGAAWIAGSGLARSADPTCLPPR